VNKKKTSLWLFFGDPSFFLHEQIHITSPEVDITGFSTLERFGQQWPEKFLDRDRGLKNKNFCRSHFENFISPLLLMPIYLEIAPLPFLFKIGSL
jgi:hypothetical protein